MTFKSQKGKSPVNKKINHQSFKTMEDTLKNVRTKLKKIKKGSCKSKKRKRNDSSESDSSWSVGLDSTGELAHIENVAHKIDKRKTESYPTNLIKTIPLDVNHSSFLEQKKNSPQHDTCGVTAVAAVLEAGPELCPKRKKMKNKYCK